MNCRVCGCDIHPERAEFFDTCREHASVVKDVCYMDYGHKTAPQLVRVRGDDEESIRRAVRVFRRER